jgi:hypothetical protein
VDVDLNEELSGDRRMESISDISSEEELLKLREEGKISEDEYKDLLAAMRKSPVDKSGGAVDTRKAATLQDVPWQIWIVVAVLGLEGVGNLLIIPQQPMALIWLGAKCVFILGLLKGWRWAFCLFVVVGIVHVVFFMLEAPVVALLNIAIVALALTSFRFYFPSQAEYDKRLGSDVAEPQGGNAR